MSPVDIFLLKTLLNGPFRIGIKYVERDRPRDFLVGFFTCKAKESGISIIVQTKTLSVKQKSEIIVKFGKGMADTWQSPAWYLFGRRTHGHWRWQEQMTLARCGGQ